MDLSGFGYEEEQSALFPMECNLPRLGFSRCICYLEEIGGAEEDRTPDLRIANASLSQLSYGPTLYAEPTMAGVARLLSMTGGSVKRPIEENAEIVAAA